jgi:hypothetical protein
MGRIYIAIVRRKYRFKAWRLRVREAAIEDAWRLQAPRMQNPTIGDRIEFKAIMRGDS